MKHLVEIQVTPKAGQDNETRPGGPGPIVARLVERFKPEAIYMSPARRTLFLVCELDATDMAELMSAGCHLSGQHPDFVPVIAFEEFGSVIGKALPAARKLIDG
jgi:hypothetical protein